MEEMKATATPDIPEDAAKSAATDAKAEKAEKKKSKKLEAELAEAAKKLEAAEAAAKACEDKYLRMMAEYDNFRKRSAKEKESVYADAYADCIANILPILDNLERESHSDNLEAVKKEAERFGISTTVSYHPLFPWRINALVLGEECSLFVEESAKGSVSEAEEIDKQINALVKKAEGCLTEASNVHFNIESIYVSAMDFVKKESFTSDFIDKLRSSNALTNIK